MPGAPSIASLLLVAMPGVPSIASLLLVAMPGAPSIASLLLVLVAMPGAPIASLLLVAMPGAPSIASLLLVAMPGAPSIASLLLVAMPGAPNRSAAMAETERGDAAKGCHCVDCGQECNVGDAVKKKEKQNMQGLLGLAGHGHQVFKTQTLCKTQSS